MGQRAMKAGTVSGLASGSNELDQGREALKAACKARVAEWQARVTEEAQRLARVLALSVPPEAMQAAPVAPARGPMRLEDNWIVGLGGARRRDGAHWRDVCPLEAMVVQAARRHASRGTDAPFVPPFTPGQIAIAAYYRTLVEWREGSAMKCASLEAGRSGGGSGGLFIDTYIERGATLARLQDRIGAVVVMDVRRHMDRGNARRPISARQAVDSVVLAGKDLTAVLAAHGWATKAEGGWAAQGKHRKELRKGIAAALDRMQGYFDEGA